MATERQWPQIGDRGYLCAGLEDAEDYLLGHTNMPTDPRPILDEVVFVELRRGESSYYVDAIRFLNITNPWVGPDGKDIDSGIFDAEDSEFGMIGRTPSDAMVRRAQYIEEYAARCLEYARLLRQWAGPDGGNLLNAIVIPIGQEPPEPRAGFHWVDASCVDDHADGNKRLVIAADRYDGRRS